MTSASDLRKALLGDGEIAVIDVREEWDFRQNHLLAAVNIPLSRLEQLAGRLLPCKHAPIVVCDDGIDRLARRVAQRFEWLGYTNVSILEGGTRAWQAAGHMLFAGSNVPSKAFGEFVEHAYRTPSIDADELKAKIDASQDMVILDSRPWEEFRLMSIPGGIDCPGAELVYRASEQVPSPDTLIVVNCAGRTRSIIGAQSLRNAGYPNRVVALRDGTMGWQLAGWTVAEGAQAVAPAPSRSAIERSKLAARDVADRAGVRRIDRAQFETFRKQRDRHTLYVLDVRTPQEFEAGHLPDSVHAFGGQLVQNTDQYIAVRGARIVLVDDTEVRALMTASWLRQMGWDHVFVLADGIVGEELKTGRDRGAMLGLERCSAPSIQPSKLRTLLSADAVALIDLADARKFVAGHIPGAWFAVRSKLPDGKEKLAGKQVVFTSSDGRFAKLAADEMRADFPDAMALEGGTSAWIAAGYGLETGEDRLMHSRIESWSPYDAKSRTKEAMLEYLKWEVALYDKVLQDGTVRFRMLADARPA